MNIFASSKCPKESAMALDNKRVNKMIIESMQMLCAVLRIQGCNDVPYKMTHKSHPCTLWASESYLNFEWLYNHMSFLNIEYKKRYNKDVDHKIFRLAIEYNILQKGLVYSNNKDMLTPFVNCTANHKEIDNVHEAYRQCLVEKWNKDKQEPKWSNTNVPVWYNFNREISHV